MSVLFKSSLHAAVVTSLKLTGLDHTPTIDGKRCTRSLRLDVTSLMSNIIISEQNPSFERQGQKSPPFKYLSNNKLQ